MIWDQRNGREEIVFAYPTVWRTNPESKSDLVTEEKKTTLKSSFSLDVPDLFSSSVTFRHLASAHVTCSDSLNEFTSGPYGRPSNNRSRFRNRLLGKDRDCEAQSFDVCCERTVYVRRLVVVGPYSRNLCFPADRPPSPCCHGRVPGERCAL